MRFFARLMFWRPRREAGPTHPEHEFVFPTAIATFSSLTSGDMEVVQQLTRELRTAGVIDKQQLQASAFQQTPENLDTLLRQAAAAAQTEREINADYYDPQVDTILRSGDYMNRMYSEDPSLDGLDDEGVQVYETYAPEARLDTPKDHKPIRY